VVAERPASGGDASSAPSERATVDVTTPGAAIAIAWDVVAGAAGYRVYRRGPSGDDAYFATTSPSFDDTGLQGKAGAPPRRGTVWTVKNLLELKNARNVVIDGNLIEHHWAQSQSGYAILFSPRNQNGRAPWSRLENIRFTNNVVRKMGAAINMSGADDLRPSGRTHGVVIANNLFVGIDGKEWGGNGDFVQIGHGPADVVIEHNTVSHTGRILSLHGNARLPREVEGLVFRANVLRHNRYGVIGGGTGVGQSTFESYLPGAVFEGNVIAGGRAAMYPKNNHFIAEAEFDRLFVDAAADDYRLKGGAYAEAGVNLALLKAAASSGAPASGAAPLRSSR
jgi:hypothetical protein